MLPRLGSVKIAVVYGTRPEAIKLQKLVSLLPDCTVIRTGQHTSLADGLLEPTISLNLPSDGHPVDYARACVRALEPRLRGVDLVVVQGDTASAYAGAEAATRLGIPVAHVEAGLRTGNLEDPWPEEGFRVGIDKISTFLFAPTETAAWNLREEGCSGVIHIVGNTGIDALFSHTFPVKHPYPVQPRVLVTLHRRESFGAPLIQIIEGLIQTAHQFPAVDFFWPVHPNPHVSQAIQTFSTLHEHRNGHPKTRNVYLMPPMDPYTFAQLLSTSRAVLTDSGGVQEEAAALGIPCVIARNVTDRPESVENFHALLAGTTTPKIREALHKALTYELSHDPSPCFGDGHAAEKIAQVLLNQHVSV